MTHKEATKIVLEITRRLCKRQRVVLRFYDGREVSISCCHIHWPHAEGDDFGVGCHYTDWEDGIEKSQVRYAVCRSARDRTAFSGNSCRRYRDC